MVVSGAETNGAGAAAPPVGKVKSVVLVGGVSKATRFRPLSLDLPKPLFPISGMPMIQHHCEALAAVEGMTEIIIMGFFDEVLFTDFMETMNETLGRGINLRYLRESDECGTAGGLYRYRDVIMQGNPEAVLVLHGDIGCSFPLSEMLSFHATKSGDCTVLGKGLDETEAHKYGCMVVDGKTSELRHYAEKPVSDISTVVNAGVYVFSPSLFDHLGKVGDEVNRGSTYRPYFSAKEAQNIYIEQDILMSLAGRDRVFVYEPESSADLFWCQIKDPAGALRASAGYLEHFKTKRPDVLATRSASMRAKVGASSRGSGKLGGTVGVGSSKLTIVGGVYVDKSATVHPSATIGPNVAIGAGVTVGPGVRLMNCIVLEDCVVSDHAVVSHSILGWGSSVGHWARVQGTASKPSVLGAGVTVEPEIIVAGCTVLPHKGLNESCHNQIIL